MDPSAAELRQLMAVAVRMREEGRTSDPRYNQIVAVLRSHQQRIAEVRQGHGSVNGTSANTSSGASATSASADALLAGADSPASATNNAKANSSSNSLKPPTPTTKPNNIASTVAASKRPPPTAAVAPPAPSIGNNTSTAAKKPVFTEPQLTHLHQQIRTFKMLSRTMDELIAKDTELLKANNIPAPHVPTAPTPAVLLSPVKTEPIVEPSKVETVTLALIEDVKAEIEIAPVVPMKKAKKKPLQWQRGDQQLVYVAPPALEHFIMPELLDDDDDSEPTDTLSILQAHLRDQMMLAYHVQLARLGDPISVDRHWFKRKRPVLSVYDPSDRERRMKSLSNEKKRRAQRHVYLRAVLSHAREFQSFHKARVASLGKVSRNVKAFVESKANKAEREEDRQEKLRLKALKANDMAAYSKLVAEAKNERLTYLLSQTNTYLDSIRALVKSHREKYGLIPGGPSSGEKDESGEEIDEELDYLGIAVNSEMPRQPQMLVGGDLKEYQLRGLQWMVSLYDNRLNGILADEMGLGKTIQSISLVTYIMEIKHNHGPFLVVVPLSTLSNWVNEFRKWAPDIVMVVYKGHPQARKDIFRLEMASVQFNVLLTTYEYIMKDKHVLRKYDWQYIIVDEGHRMKNAQSKFAMTLGSLYTSRNRLLLTGTPLQNSLPELWSLLNFLLPTIFESVDNFEQWFSKPFSHFTGTGETNELSDEERMLIINRLHQVLRPFLLRRVKSSVLDQLPDKVERVLRCELSGWQKIMYRRIQEGGSLLMEGSSTSGGDDSKKSFTAKGLSNILMQLRKVCNHPYLFQTQGYPIDFDIVRSSGKFELLDRMLPKLHAAGHRVLMFSQMTQLMHVLEDYFNYRGFRYLRLDGSTSADEREQRMFMFNAPDSPYFIFLLSTRAGGLGLNLATADTVIIFDSDWNPAMDAQAQDRAHRIGQKNEVRVFRLITNSPIEEKILSRATEKLNMNNLVVEAGKFHAKSKEADRRAMLESLIKMENEEATEEALVIDNDELNSIMALTPSEEKLYQDIDQERSKKEAKQYGAAFIRLMNTNDVPSWLKDADAAETLKEHIDPVSLAAEIDLKRKRKDVSYRDMSEAQFSKILDEGGGDDEDETQNLMKMKPSSKKQKVAAPSSSSSNSAYVVEMTTERLRQVYDAVLKVKDSKGRLRHTLFIERPSATDYPDYYTIVNEAMDLQTIESRIEADEYSSFGEMESDFKLLFDNAQLYNHRDSLVYHDAVEMAKVVKSKLNAFKRSKKKK
ncbi:Aste57867_23899 [Aphanomyces stellatus]|uniref:Aste57867_23899 protein n=1 Tax=Aphanomyces stellatus TaxID=120398 RepID=A0A485LQJ7_9STRA|nr:hypothetical protein As57867_023826 [Aphanomyces stellatus]VFU00542.1 Aste57867_23899 [Aphanomyces stellatus]